jgi:hypothetical protein
VIRRLLIGLLALLVVLVVAADRVGEHVAAHVLAGKLQTDEHLTSRPSVSVSGFPFLTQAVHGDYHDVTVTARDYTTEDHVQIDTLKVHLRGVHVPLSKVIDGSVSTVPVDHVDGTVFVSFADISTYLAGHGLQVVLSPTTTGGVGIAGQSTLGIYPRLVRGVATLGVSDSALTLTLKLSKAATTPLVLTIPLRSLPFQIAVTSVQVGLGGITGTGTANNIVLGN